MGQIDDIQAQLGNLLSGLPAKVQKVDVSYLNVAEPPFEGAMAADAAGQFYISDSDGAGNLVWKAIQDVNARQEALSVSNQSVTFIFEVPLGFGGGTIPFGATFEGDVSVFVQYEPPDDADMVFYATAVKNITQSGFDLHLSADAQQSGGKVHVMATSTGGVMSQSSMSESTGATDAIAPTLSSSAPSDNDVDVSTEAGLVLNFSEPVIAGSGNIELRLSSDGSLVESIDVASGQVAGSGTGQIAVSFSSATAHETEYYITIGDTCFDDAAENSYAGISDSTTLSFTTAPL